MKHGDGNSNGLAVCEVPIDVSLGLTTRLESGSEATRDLANLDLLRAVAVGLVVVGHLLGTMAIRGFGGLGHLGVLFFFVHTALVLMLSMERLGLTGSSLYMAFLIRRIFRIYPLSVLAVLLVVACEIPSISWLGGYARPGWTEFLSNIFLTQNITHSGSVISVLWSLPFEIQMYAALPVLYLLMRRFPSVRTAWLMWLAGVAIAGLEYMVRNRSGASYLLTRYFPCFLAGILAWRMVTTRRVRLPGMLWILVLAIFITTYRMVDAFRVYGPAVFQALHGPFRNDHGFWWPGYLDLVNDWIFCVLAGLMVPLFSEITLGWLVTISKRIAQYSYGIYLSHVPVLWLCFKLLHLGSLALSAMLSLLLTALVSVVLFHWVEIPSIRFGKRLAAQLIKPTLA